MNKLLILMILAAVIPLVSYPTLANADIKVTPPLNWQPSPNNNSTSMIWYQNSTKSVFGINKAPDILSFPLFLAGPFVTQFLTDKGVLESADQISFGNGNYGYRYILNLSSPSKLLNSFSGLPQIGSFLTSIPQGYDVPYKGMLILTQKQGDLYAIIFLSPIENFDSKLKDIKASIDSIQFNWMINEQGQMLNILLNNLLQNAITQIKFQAQIKLPAGSSISGSNSEMIRALGNIMPCPPESITNNINPNAE